MSNLSWAVLCRRAVIDRETNEINLIQILEDLGIGVTEELPITDPPKHIPMEMTLVSFWYATNDEEKRGLEVREALEGPNGTERTGVPREVHFTETGRFARVLTKIDKFPYLGSGLYYWRVERKQDSGEWQVQARVPFRLSVEVKEQ